MLKLMKAMHRSEKGFTLVELMVVVVIIGVLVAIVIPVFNMVQANAREKTCFANQRIIEGAALQYHADNGSYPANINLDLVGDYLQTEPICPDATDGYTIISTTGKVSAGGVGCAHTHYTDVPPADVP